MDKSYQKSTSVYKGTEYEVTMSKMTEKKMNVTMNEDGKVSSYEGAYGSLVKGLTSLKAGQVLRNEHFDCDTVDYPVICKTPTPAVITYEQAQVYLNTWASNLSRDADKATSVIRTAKGEVSTLGPAALRGKSNSTLMNIPYQIGGQNPRKINLMAYGLSGASFGARIAWRGITRTPKAVRPHEEKMADVKVAYNWGVGRTADSEGTRKDAIAWARNQKFPIPADTLDDCIGFAAFIYARNNGLINMGRASFSDVLAIETPVVDTPAPSLAYQDLVKQGIELYGADTERVKAYVQTMTTLQ
jgi:hypothetical protein